MSDVNLTLKWPNSMLPHIPLGELTEIPHPVAGFKEHISKGGREKEGGNGQGLVNAHPHV